MQNSDDYLFSFEIIVQAVYYKFKVAEVQIACDYHPDMHTADLYRSTIYAIGTFKTLIEYIGAKFFKIPSGPFKRVSIQICRLCKETITKKLYTVTDSVSNQSFSIYFCTPCQIGFTYPIPKNMNKYYPTAYYSWVKTILYQILQFRRPIYIKKRNKNGSILDIGCGDGMIGYKLQNEGFTYVGIETLFANIKNPLVKLTGIENLREKNNSYDVVTFWESFEHVPDPANALIKSFKTLKKGGHIIIECPNFSSWERLLFQNRWFHLDPPRHVFHFTHQGIGALLQSQGFELIDTQSVYAPEYIPVGLAQSILYRISPKLNIFAQKTKDMKMTLGIILAALAMLMVPFSYLFYLVGGSPIQLVVGRKK